MEKKYKGKSNIDIVKSYLNGERPFIQFGYTGKEYVKRNVGDKWTDIKGIDWEQKISGPVRVNRVADIVRSAINDKCKCGQVIKWGSRLDKIFFNRTGMCENCVISYETNLRILGIYDDYEKYKILSYQLGFLKDARDKIKEVIKFFSKNSGDVEMICNSEGFLERWKNTNKDEILNYAKNDLKLANAKVSEVKKVVKDAEKKYVEAATKYKIEIYV
jgi:hypothetical protein